MITIKTKFHPSTTTAIECGEIQTIKRFNVSPRNLMRAAEFLKRHTSEAIRSWGNVGHVRSWLEINGRAISNDDLLELDKEFHAATGETRTRTEIAKQMLQSEVTA